MKKQLNKLVNRLYKGNQVVEYDIYELNDISLPDCNRQVWELIERLYTFVFKYDNNWHYFWEDFYVIIRFSKKFEKRVVNYLKHCNVKYVNEGIWVDGSDVVRTYQSLYQQMFHTFSEMAIQDKGENIYMNYDRVSHCFLNHQYLPLLYNDKLEIKNSLWESSIMSHVLNCRSSYIGRCNAIKELRKRKEHREKYSNYENEDEKE